METFTVAARISPEDAALVRERLSLDSGVIVIATQATGNRCLTCQFGTIQGFDLLQNFCSLLHAAQRGIRSTLELCGAPPSFANQIIADVLASADDNVIERNFRATMIPPGKEPPTK